MRAWNPEITEDELGRRFSVAAVPKSVAKLWWKSLPVVGTPGDDRVVYEIDEEASVVLVHWVQQRTVVLAPR
ncbi:MAG: hypothetical protein QOK43_2007 [Acidimicrobiaceae bacterium]|nr:hypothetical protein [Acidimicrobiaceae bacterium]